MDLFDLATRLDADERLKLTYRFPVSSGNGAVRYEVRTARLLDVAAESDLLYVNHDDEVIWIKVDEAIEVVSE